MAEEKKDTIDLSDESVQGTEKPEETPKAEIPVEEEKAPARSASGAAETETRRESKRASQGGEVKAEKTGPPVSDGAESSVDNKKPAEAEKKEVKKTEAKKTDKKDDKSSSGGQGFNPMKRRKRTSEYGQQLSEKQLAKKIYGVRERQFRNYYKEAFRQQGDTGDILRQLLQMRLDNIIYQSGLAKTTRAARQMVSHNYFLVNGKKVNIPSYQVQIKDVITVKPEKEGKKIWDDEAKERIEDKDVPGWLALDKKTKTIKITSKPVGDELNQEFNTRSIVEFYSR